MRRSGCQTCGYPIDFGNLVEVTTYPGITYYTCPECGAKGRVFSGHSENYWDTRDEAWENDQREKKERE